MEKLWTLTPATDNASEGSSPSCLTTQEQRSCNGSFRLKVETVTGHMEVRILSRAL